MLNFSFFKSKRFVITAVVFIATVVFLISAWYGLSWYGEWSLRRDIRIITENTNRPYLEDTYGGKTPKETLELFIAAVEKGDFDLASKYFILSKQGEWRDKLIKGKEKDNINNLIKLVNEEIDILNNADSLWVSDNNYISTNKVLFEYIKYPRGIWKIKEI